MRAGPAVRILVVAAASVLALVGLVARESLARRNGTEVLLAMEAVDPRALLTGHYVSITLREVLDPGVACPPGASEAGSAPSGRKPTHWIALARRGAFASAAEVTTSRVQASRGGRLAVRGEAYCDPPAKPSEGDPGRPAVVSLDLGVDRFHVSQSEAERIDALLLRRHAGQESPVAAIVSIGGDGRARLKGLLVEGRRMELSLI